VPDKQLVTLPYIHFTYLRMYSVV